eukprot:TRINITY_DN7240_c0_g2_i1.p1 TRINITY_DN7240_c0_g2~~TRINITY_DN7240_c0_g2_i1.p1  ORF type:complete len:1058 (+),score=261.81 TRINITY_DN7240_c0_g2_i1:302-3475(+)
MAELLQAFTTTSYKPSKFVEQYSKKANAPQPISPPSNHVSFGIESISISSSNSRSSDSLLGEPLSLDLSIVSQPLPSIPNKLSPTTNGSSIKHNGLSITSSPIIPTQIRGRTTQLNVNNHPLPSLSNDSHSNNNTLSINALSKSKSTPSPSPTRIAPTQVPLSSIPQANIGLSVSQISTTSSSSTSSNNISNGKGPPKFSRRGSSQSLPTENGKSTSASKMPDSLSVVGENSKKKTTKEEQTVNPAFQLIQQLLDNQISEDAFSYALEDYPSETRMECIKEIAAHLKKANTILNFSTSISKELDLSKGAERVSEQACEILQADRASLYLLDEARGELVSKSSRLSRKGKATSTPEIRVPVGVGIAGRVAATGETLNIPNAYRSQYFYPEIDRYTGYRTKSVLCMPVMDHSGRVVAVLEALNKRKVKEFAKEKVAVERHPIESFDEEDVDNMKTLAHHAGISLRNAQLYQESQESQNKVKVLLEVASQLASELDTTTLITVIMTKSKLLLDADRCTLFLLDAERGELWSKVADGAKEIRIPSNKGIAGHVVTTGEVLNIKDAYLDTRFNPEVDKKTGYRTKSILCMPLRNNKTEIIGVTQMINKKDGSVFTRADEQLLQAFSAQAAVAIENSKLFQKTSEMRNYLQSILQSITNLVLTLDLSGRLNSTNRPVDNVFGMDEKVLRSDSYQVWLGSQNKKFADHISQVYTDPTKPAEQNDYEFIHGESVVHINYAVLPLIMSDVKGSNSRSIQGVVIIIEDVTSQKRMRSTLNRYMSPALAEQVVKEGGDRLGGVHLTVTTLFSDIRKFTAMSEGMDAGEVVAMLNEYFSHMVGVVFDEGGVLDKYIGDAMMACFGVPFQKQDDSIRACRAALEMLRRLKKLNAKREARGETPINIGIGINTGKVLSGNIGSEKRLEYTVIGDGVNLASRMEGVTKTYGVKVLLTEFTYKEVYQDFVVRELDSIRVVGKQHPVRIYELLGEKGKLDEVNPLILKGMDPFREGLNLYRRGAFMQARAYFQEANEASQHTDYPSQVFIERCEMLIRKPPVGNWEGIYDMLTK